MRAPRWLVGERSVVAASTRPEARAALLVALVAVNVAFLPLLARTDGNSAGDRDARVGLEAIAVAQGPWWEPHLTLARLAPGATYRLEGGSPPLRGRVDRQLVPPMLLTVGRAERWEHGPSDGPAEPARPAPREVEVPCRSGTCLLLLDEGPPSLLIVVPRRDGITFVDGRLVGAER